MLKQLVLKLPGDRISLRKGHRGVQRHVEFCIQAVSDPPGTHIENLTHPGNVFGSVANLGGHLRIDAIVNFRR